MLEAENILSNSRLWIVILWSTKDLFTFSVNESQEYVVC